MGKRRILLALLIFAGSGQAGVVLDQYQIAFQDIPLAIGGSSQQMLAQTFEAGLSGTLSHVTLVFSCEPDSVGLLTIEIQHVGADGRPNGIVLGGVSMASGGLHLDPITFRDVPIPGVNLFAGEQYAIVMRGQDSVACAGREGVPEGGWFHYPRGSAYFDARPNPPGWQPFTPGEDLPFYTYMIEAAPGAPRYCEFRDASGIANDWLLNDVPICGCLSDAQLRVNRCWFALPDLLVWRELPLPWEYPKGLAQWGVTPLVTDLPALYIEEYDPQGQFRQEPAQFKASLPPGQAHLAQARYRGVTEGTEVLFYLDGPTGLVKITFETSLEAVQ